ncbi:hypothetical protein [Priestia megaterium]|uniref:hypothetical protein n=1 Tax=Priestia megaterium TaxID=1404 RepID=UPI003CC57C51
MKTYELDLEVCPLCSSELKLIEHEDYPEWKMVCNNGHFEQMIAFWGCYFTINDMGFSVPSLENENEVREVNQYLLSIGANEIA